MQNLTSVRVYASVLAGLALGLVAASWSLHGLGRWDVVLVLAVIAHVAEGRSMRVSPRVEVSVSFMPLALAAVLFGPAAAGLVGAAAMLHREGPLERFLIYLSGKTLAGCAAGWTAVVAERMVGVDSLMTLVAVAAVASVVGTGVEFFVTAVTLLIRHGTRPLELWRLLRGSIAVSVALYAPVTALIAFTYARVGVEAVAFFVVPLIAAHLSFGMHARQAQLIEELGESNDQLEAANAQLRRVNISFAAAMVRALDSRDNYTAGHSAAVAVYSRDIARRGGPAGGGGHRDPPGRPRPRHRQDRPARGAAREAVGSRRRRVGRDARAPRRSEPGSCAEVEDYSDIALIVRSHHERWDGAGYPDGLAGHAIPRLARIIAVADSYNAMTTEPSVPRGHEHRARHPAARAGEGDASSRRRSSTRSSPCSSARPSSYQRGRMPDFSIEAQRHSVLPADDAPASGHEWGAAVA